jgi:aquaporin Z
MEAKVEAAAAAPPRLFWRIDNGALRQPPLWVRLIVEFVGTFILVCVAAGAGVINEYLLLHHHGAEISRAAAVVAPGALVMALIYALGPLSGLHINPAVTLAFTARRVFRASWALPYVCAQLLGACAGALFLQLVYGHVGVGGNHPIQLPGGEWRSLLMEILCTAILVTVILHTATGYKSIGHNAALAVGSTVALLGLFASPISGASMNPARTLGPDLVGADLRGWWIYVVGPVVGAMVSVVLIRIVRGPPSKEETESAEGGFYPVYGTTPGLVPPPSASGTTPA